MLLDEMTIAGLPLEGEFVRLEPVAAAHRDEMRVALDCDPETWQIYSISGYREHFPAFWELMLNAPDRISYAVRDKASGTVAGTSSMFQIDRRHRTLEIGFTWYRPEYRGTYVNPETKLLMMGHAFASGALRVQFSVDTRNARSQAAMSRFATREGVLRRHRVTWTGHKRDTAMFSVTDEEWPEVERKLKQRLAVRLPRSTG